MIRQSASLNCQTIWDYRPTVVTATLAVFQLNNILWARKCQTQSRHHPRRRRRVCHVRLGTRPWYEAVVRKQVTDTPPVRRGVAASRRRARRRRNSKDSEAQRRAHPPSRPPGRPRRRHSARRHSARRHRRHERACSNQQHSRATTTRSRPNTAQSGPRTIWCALSRRGASEGRIGVVVARVCNQHRCRFGLKGGASVGWWCGSGREPCVGSRPGLLSGKSAVERDISTASIRQGRDSIQRAVKRPETI